MPPSTHRVEPARDFPEGMAVWCEADEAISKGDACFCVGYSGGARHMVKAASTTSKHATGDILFAGYGLPAGERGKFYPWMILTDVDTSAYAQGEVLYLSSTAGGRTTYTLAGNVLRSVGQVLTVSATVGAILLEAPRPPKGSVAKTQILTPDVGITIAAGAAGLYTVPLDAFAGSTPSTLAVPVDGDYLLVVSGYARTTLAP